MTDLRSLIADTLAAHRQFAEARDTGPTAVCSCGAWSMPFDHLSIEDAAAEHRLHRADEILAALADRLLPEGGQTREETLRHYERAGLSRHWREVNSVRTVTTWPDGSRHESAWRPVESEETAAGGETP